MFDPHRLLYDLSASAWPQVANHLWQATLISALVGLAALALRRAPARTRYALWLLAYAKFALPSALLVLLFAQAGLDPRKFLTAGGQATPAAAWVSQVAEPVRRAEVISESREAARDGRAAHDETFCVLTLVWASVFVAMLGAWLARRRSFARTLKAGETLKEGRAFEALERARALLNLRRALRLVVSSGVTEPGVWGVWRPVVALPRGMDAHLSGEELDAVLLHEAAHVARRDNLVGNLQTLVRCSLWFHPLVWLIDARLLAERERACDERVLESGAEPRVYAASLLKVLRLCLASNVGGVSSATGSNLQRRVEMILRTQTGRAGARRGGWAYVSACAAALVALSAAAGLFGQTGMAARDAGSNISGDATRPGAFGDRQGEQPALAPPTPEAEGALPWSGRVMTEALMQAERAPYTAARVSNASDAPVRITSAEVKIVTPLPGDDTGANNGRVRAALVTQPRVTLVNNSARRVVAAALSFNLKPTSHDVVSERVRIEPSDSYTVQLPARKWSNIVPAANAGRLVVSLYAVQFEDGSTWGRADALRGTEEIAPPASPSAPVVAGSGETPSPAPPAALAAPNVSVEQPQLPAGGEYVPAMFINPEGAPLVVVTAQTRLGARPEDGQAQAFSFGSRGALTYLPVVSLANKTDRRIVYVKIRFKADAESHAVTAMRVSIGPGGTYTFRRGSVMSGDARDMKVQVLGVQFEDGSVWGKIDASIDTRQTWLPVN